MRSRKFRPQFESLDSRELLAAGPLGINVDTPEFVDVIKQSNGFSGARFAGLAHVGRQHRGVRRSGEPALERSGP